MCMYTRQYMSIYPTDPQTPPTPPTTTTGNKHGTCSGLSQDAYFKLALKGFLVVRFFALFSCFGALVDCVTGWCLGVCFV